jgi:hypothetical protein
MTDFKKILEYYEDEIMRIQSRIEEYNLREEKLHAWYMKEKHSGQLTPIGMKQLENQFKGELKPLRFRKKRLISDLKITKKKMDKAREDQKVQRRL